MDTGGGSGGGGAVGGGMDSSGPVNLMPLFGGGARDQGRSSNKKIASGRVLSSGMNSSNTIGGGVGHPQRRGNGSVEGLVYNH